MTGVRLASLLAGILGFAGCALAQQGSTEPIRLHIIGGLAGVTQYTKIEQPFWETEI
ncbi:MAG: ABC transporter substrate-binding protein, partial [Stutzerimonas stutzeri]